MAVSGRELAKRIAEEREACARVADDYAASADEGEAGVARAIAAEIRLR